MNRFLRTAPTRQLLATIAGLVVAIAAGTTIAIAAQGSGPVPPRVSLAKAIHRALAAPAVEGVSARISLTNNLINASELQGSNPLLSGGSGRLWVSSNHQLRLELQGDNGDAQLVVNNRSIWAYDPASNTVYKATLPASTASHAGEKSSTRHSIPSISQIQTDLTHLARHVGLGGAIPGDIAGQAAYTVRLTPKQSGGLLGAAELAWDAARGVPLRVAVYARGNSTPVLALTATDISYGKISASVFKIAPPSGAKVDQVYNAATTTATTARTHAGAKKGHKRAHTAVTGVKAVSAKLPFALDCPGQLAGIQFDSVRLIDLGSHPAALLIYGRGLGAVAVIERAASASAPLLRSTSGSGDGAHGLSLPAVTINGVTANELDTALGTVVQFSRGGVAYTVIGSVTSATADAAARGL